MRPQGQEFVASRLFLSHERVMSRTTPKNQNSSLPLDCVLNRVLLGDCLELLAQMPESSVDLVFADPPYFMQLGGQLLRPDASTVAAVDDAWDKFADDAAYLDFSRAWLGQCRRILKDTGTMWVIGSYHNIYRLGALMADLGFWTLNDVIWHKTNPMPNFRGTRLQNATETLLWCAKSKTQKHYTFNYAALKAFNDDKQMSNVWQIPLCTGAERIKQEGKKAHSTQKPEALLYRVLLASTKLGDVVLDPFFGTGTTGAVAKKLGRHFIGLEREPAYVAVAERRLAAIAAPKGEPALWHTPSRRDQPKVSFAELLAAGLVQVGQTLTDKKGRYSALVRADARLQASGGQASDKIASIIASIHGLGAQLQNIEACNGWDFWGVTTANGWQALDSLRTSYLATIDKAE